MVHLFGFCQLFLWNAALFRGVRFQETAIDRQVIAFHQAYFRTLPHDLLEQLRFLKPSVPVLGERRVMWNLLIEAQVGEQFDLPIPICSFPKP